MKTESKQRIDTLWQNTKTKTTKQNENQTHDTHCIYNMASQRHVTLLFQTKLKEYFAVGT